MNNVMVLNNLSPRFKKGNFGINTSVVKFGNKNYLLDTDQSWHDLGDAKECANSYSKMFKERTVIVPFNGVFHIGYISQN